MLNISVRQLANHAASLTPDASFATQVVIDFGQELVTSVHRPVKWSNERPCEEDFKAVFAETRISAQRIMQFVCQRQHIVRRLVLLNSEGYWSGEACIAPLPATH